jgi:hypothetical protein
VPMASKCWDGNASDSQIFKERAEALVEPGRNTPSLYAVNGRPVYVHLNGLAIVRLK